MNLVTLKIALRSFCSREFSDQCLRKLGNTFILSIGILSYTFYQAWKPSISNLKFYFCMNQINRFLLEIIKERRNKTPLPLKIC